MSSNSESAYLPVTIIALGAAAVIVGAVMVAVREQERQLVEDNDDFFADTAEVDTCAADITAANEVLSESAEVSEMVDAPSDELLSEITIDTPDVYVETIVNGRHMPEEGVSRDRFLPDDLVTEGTTIRRSDA